MNKRKSDLLIEMQHEHNPSECDHRAQDTRANPGYPLPRAEVQLLMPLGRRGAGVNHEFRVWDDHLECGDVVARRAGKQIFDVVVRAPEAKERVWRVQRLVRRLRQLWDLRG